MIGLGEPMDAVVVNVKALGEHFVRDHGPDQPVLVLCEDRHANRFVLRRTVATQLKVGTTVRFHLGEVVPPHDPPAAALAAPAPADAPSLSVVGATG